MNRIIFLIVGVISFVSVSHGQVGITGGFNLASVRNAQDNIMGFQNTYKLGFQFGAFYDVKLSEQFYIRPQCLFIYEAYKKEKEETGMDYRENSNLYGISVPVLFSYRVPINENKIFFDVGPYFSVGLFDNYDVSYKAGDSYTERKNHSDLGLMGGAGLEINKFMYSVHCKYGLQEMERYGDKSLTFLFSVGYKFQ
jgi:hypothetical protein